MKNENNKSTGNPNYEYPKVKGIHTFSVCKMVTAKALELQDRIEKNGFMRRILLGTSPQGTVEQRALLKKQLHSLWLSYRNLIDQLHRDFKVRETVVENITTTVGRSVLAQRLGGDTTYTGTVNYTALGDDNTAPVVGDATLGNEVYRKLLTSGTDSNNIAYLETFLTATEDADTYEEYAMYIDGTGSVDTGQLFNRFTQQITKSLTETLNVQSIITFNDA